LKNDLLREHEEKVHREEKEKAAQKLHRQAELIAAMAAAKKRRQEETAATTTEEPAPASKKDIKDILMAAMAASKKPNGRSWRSMLLLTGLQAILVAMVLWIYLPPLRNGAEFAYDDEWAIVRNKAVRLSRRSCRRTISFCLF
jgi:cobalamin biosynthesis Mg chelatase CobN